MISAIILTKNEEKNIKDCLSSLSWSDEKIIIDDESTDKTVEIAKKLGAKVFIHRLSEFSDQRNYAMEKAGNEWILFIDADERISPALWYEITHRLNDPGGCANGYYFRRIDKMWNKELRFGESKTLKLLRLARIGKGKWSGTVHEKWHISGKTETLNNPLHHFPHPTIAEFLSEINKYTDLRAQELFNQKIKTNSFLIIVYPVSKFILNYIFKLGILDGLPGLLSALMMSYHSFLVRGKLWLLWDKK